MKLFVALLTILGNILLVLSPAYAATASKDEYEGMNVLCVGCSSGIGKSAAEHLLAGGAQVVISSRTQSKCDEVAKAYKKAFAIVADASNAESLEKLVEQSRKAFKGNNKKITHLVWVPTSSSFGNLANPAEDLIKAMQDQLDLNVYNLIRTFKLIEDDLNQSQGAVVSVSSYMGSTSTIGSLSYGFAKTAQDRIIKDLAIWGASNGVRVNAVAPACIETPMFEVVGDYKDTLLQDFTWRHALGRNGQPDEVGSVIAFLLSKKAGFITGQTITIDGGASLLNTFTDVNNFLLPPDLVHDKTYFSKHTPPPSSEDATQQEQEL
ncbi:dichloro-2,5-cyclohexadiene-1,4-diol dehydrogenase [Seminavis robusta]|uniref:Dichloro-2,5-cyclohexadiene-1,4-diol dehydrogenase n=1 Tax=Seminavis robusta TaxID=568900 RepID=A0A9N8DFU1_9STRA|nr:dichloro-2,5-cyclohexadiene-1,4-diol dehydrogenase [Seminavis robusta]|eukprot:Sro48_g028090.1 dichloro-2,5-cyclohexadiene-1,4-diol dehydrogenase (322) ;mRNA; r:15979-16944